MSGLPQVTIYIAASAPIQTGIEVERSGWAAYGRSGEHHKLLDVGADPAGGTPARMYLLALATGESPGVVGFGGSLRAVDTPESLVSPLGWAIA
ncbi:hypothetical protein GCM10023217_19130 [Gordonia alkaliphila]|uniref:Uncharacterized protein n=1 Tax=Gordonia alkaliphila TaxID=1053547 RepID=A0ABP8Z7Y8_9ACTN